MTTPPDTPTPPNAATDRRTGPARRGKPTSAADGAQPRRARTGLAGRPTARSTVATTPTGARRACPRCASARRWRRACSPSAWPSARRSAPRPARRSRASSSPRWCSPRSPPSRRGRRRINASTAQPSTPPPVTPQATPASGGREHETRAPRRAAKSKTPSSTRVSPTSTPNTSKTRPPRPAGQHQADDAVPPVTHVWLITLVGRHVRAGARPAGRRPLHRLPARARRRAAERLVLARRQRVRQRGRAARRRAAAERWTRSCSRRARKAPPARRASPKPPGALSAADEFLKATVPHDHLEPRLQRTRPDRDHVRRGRQRHRLQPARRLLDRDALERAARGRPLDLAVRPRRHAAEHGV